MNKTIKKILLQYLLSFILLAFFLWLIYLQISRKGSWRAEWVKFSESITLTKLSFILVGLVLAPLNWLAEAVKWQLLLKKIEKIPLKRAYASVLSGISIALISPNKTGDFLGRILFLKKKNWLHGSIASLLASFSQVVVTFLFGFLGMIYLQVYYSTNWTIYLLIAASAGLALLLYFYINIDRLSKVATRFKKLRLLVISFYVLKRYSRKELWKILGIALLRFCIYTFQFLILLYSFNGKTPFFTGFFLAGLMFWLITVIPTFFVADIGVRGFVTGLVFISTGVCRNPFPVLCASYLLWLMNWALPAVIGSILIVWEKIFKRKRAG